MIEKIKTDKLTKRIAITTLPVIVLSTLAMATSKEEQQIAIPQNALIVDVRTTPEYLRGHYPGAKNIPLSSVSNRISEFGPMDQTVLVYCRSGRRSGIAQDLLKKAGYQKTINGGGLDKMLRHSSGN